MVDNQDLVICSEKFTYLSLRQGAMLSSEKDKKKTDVVTMYQNRSKELAILSIDDYFYKYFCREVLKDTNDTIGVNKSRILLPVGQNCKPCYPVTYEYAEGVLIQYKPWSKDKTTDKVDQRPEENHPYI